MCTDLANLLIAIAAHGDDLTVILKTDTMYLLRHNITEVVTSWNLDPNSGLFCVTPMSSV